MQSLRTQPNRPCSVILVTESIEIPHDLKGRVMPGRPSNLSVSELPAPRADDGAPRWLLFVHQLPARPSNLRVSTWRRLQQMGALAIKQAVYVLPDAPAAREDFEWLKTEVEAAGGEASVFAAGSVDAWSDDALVDAFRRSRQDAYTTLAGEIEATMKKVDSSIRRPAGRAPAIARLAESLRQRLTAIERVDFFDGAGRDRVSELLARLETRLATRTPSKGPAPSASTPVDRSAYRGRTWVTRPRPGVDRMSSAWLIRRFIDPDAQFAFAADRRAVPADVVPFDMFGVELTHRGDRCTFETLCEVFNISGSAVARLAGIVHDLDLKDGRYGVPETPAVGLIVDGLQLAFDDDRDLLAQGIVLFDALHRATERDDRPPAPRVAAGPSGANRARTRGREKSR
jgi:hypothetical protein